MQLAILIGSNPKTAQISARVRLHKGLWKLVHEGLNDSVLGIHVLTSPPHIELEDRHKTYEMRGDSLPLELLLANTTLLYVDWINRGSEKAINLSAHIKNGT